MRVSRSFVGFALIAGALPFFLAGSKPVPVPHASAPEERTGDGDTFRFPEDKGGELLAKLLAPPATLPREQAKPRPRQTSRAIAQPTLPLPRVALVPRVVAEATRRTPAPSRLLTPEPALGGLDTALPLPQTQQFPVSARLRVASEDVARPVGLGVMARPLPDAGALADPTLSASRTAALGGRLPQRTQPAPYLRLTLPDPYEHRDTVRLRQPLGDEPVPNTTTRVP